MKYYKIVYTYYHRGVEDEQEMLIKKPSLPDALAYVRQMDDIYCLEDFGIVKVYVRADDKAAWVEVPDWEEIERQHRKEI